ncbi:MAG: hypothetical protein AB1546_00480 [bacterium]
MVKHIVSSALLFFLYTLINSLTASAAPLQVVLPYEIFNDAALQLAAHEFADTYHAIAGAEASVVPSGNADTQLDSLIIHIGIDLPDGTPSKVQPPENDEAFSIYHKDYATLILYAGDIRGAIYGLFYLAERLKLDPEYLKNVNISNRKPAFAFRYLGSTPENGLRGGYNTVGAVGDHYKYLLFTDIDPEMFKDWEKTREEIIQRQQDANKEIKRIKSLHLDTITGSDEFAFPKALINRPYAKEMLRPDTNYICFCSGKIWELYDAKYKELLQVFPDVDIVKLRLGENYAKDDYFGNIVGDVNFWNDCTQCMNIKYNDRIATVINRTHDLVVSSGKRRYIHRSWDTLDNKFHANPEVYLDIISKLKNKDNLYISIKYTATDYWRYTFPNPTIGVGDVPQIIEFQNQREYEGKGAFPDYMGEEFTEAYRYIKAKGAVGVSNGGGGGWGGPVLKTNMWNDANFYASGHLMWEPNLDARTLSEEWATINFGKQYAKGIADMLLLSDDAVLKMIYFKAYAERKQSKWMTNENWVRDDVIKPGERLSIIYHVAADKVDEMIAEKDEAIQVVKKMIGIAESLNLPEPQRSQVLESLDYEYRLFSVLRNYCAAYFFYRRWKDTSNPDDLALARSAADAWQKDWQNYQSLNDPNLKWTASLYKDDGMVETMEKIISEIKF